MSAADGPGTGPSPAEAALLAALTGPAGPDRRPADPAEAGR